LSKAFAALASDQTSGESLEGPIACPGIGTRQSPMASFVGRIFKAHAAQHRSR